MRMTLLSRSLLLAMALLAAPEAARVAWAGQAPVQMPAVVRVTVARASIYDKAATNGAVVVAVVRGDQLDVIGVSGTFYRVRTRVGNRTGFITMASVERVATGPAATVAAPAQAGLDAMPPPQPARPVAEPVRPAVTARPAAEPPVHVRGFVGMDRLAPAASNTFAALGSGSSSLFTGFTAGVDVYGRLLPFQTFIRLGLSQTKLDGERVVVVDNSVFSTGIPLKVTMRPVQFGAGIRFAPKNAAARSLQVTPYGGVGTVMLTYREVSSFADDGDNVSESHSGLSVFGGVDLRFTKWLSAGVEAEYRSISGFGTGGVSEIYDEDQFGGLSLKFLIGVSK